MKNPPTNGSNLIEAIEIRQTISITDLAQQSFFSKRHYQRLFKAIAGEPVMKYVKNRRLQLACQDLLAENLTILEIALKYNYNSHEAFTRAFKGYFGVVPSEYRKINQKSTKMEVIKMLSNEILSRIAQNAEKISATLKNFSESAEELAKNAIKSAKIAGVSGKSTIIVANELKHLVHRIKVVRNEHLKTLTIANTTAVEMFDKIFTLIKTFDDIGFQMNLLRFFSGVETGRIAPPKADELAATAIDFAKIDEEYGILCGKIIGEKAEILNLMHEGIELIHADIKQEAANCLKSVVNLLQAAQSVGEETAKAAQNTVQKINETFGGRSGAFAHIAENVNLTLDVLQKISIEIGNGINLSAALTKLENSAFSMNITAFNASIESARMGNFSEENEENESNGKINDIFGAKNTFDKILQYAGILQKTQRECKSLINQHKQLTELSAKNTATIQQNEQSSTDNLNDIILQSGILTDQFTLETERKNSEEYRKIAKKIKTAHENLLQTQDISLYSKQLAEFLQELKILVFSPEVTLGSFAYIFKEFEHFLDRI